jgi:ParB family chromosome partitioning protein
MNEPEAAGEEYQTPHPEGITSLCYSCTKYETCNVKTGTCTSCDQYENRAEANKTEEQRYSEEQDAIDRETQRKLREKADEERMNNIPSETGENGQKVHQIRLGESFFEDACSNAKSFELRKNDRGYKKGDILELMEFADGRNTGRMVRKLVTYILEDYTGLEDGFCIMATALVDKDDEPLQNANIGQICADIKANGDGYIDGGEEFILIDKAVSIVRDGGRE